MTVYNVKDSYKTFVSPDDYHRKVVQKLREFNEAIDQVTRHYTILLLLLDDVILL